MYSQARGHYVQNGPASQGMPTIEWSFQMDEMGSSMIPAKTMGP